MTYDLGDVGLGAVQGIDAIRDAAIAMGDRSPVGHHVTNVILTEIDSQATRARSRGSGFRRTDPAAASSMTTSSSEKLLANHLPQGVRASRAAQRLGVTLTAVSRARADVTLSALAIGRLLAHRSGEARNTLAGWGLRPGRPCALESLTE